MENGRKGKNGMRRNKERGKEGSEQVQKKTALLHTHMKALYSYSS